MAQLTTAEGVNIDYEVRGDGPVVVLVHGITEHRGSWDPLVPMLVGRGYRVIASDLRGHGASGSAGSYDLVSMAGDLAAVIQAEEATDALLIGHSLGGAVVSAYAAGGPCRGVINVDQPLALGSFKESLTALEPMLRGSPEDCAAAIVAIFDQMVGPLAGPELSRINALRTADQEVVLGVWDLVLTAPVADLDAVVDQLAAAITVPYLSLHGIDPGPDYATWLTAKVPSATVEVWADHGHYPHLVDPARFVDRVLAADSLR